MYSAIASYVSCIVLLIAVTSAHALTITPTTDGTSLADALGGTGLTIDSVTVTSGAAEQVGTYANFSNPPIAIGNGVVLSTGRVAELLPSFNNGAQGASSTPSTDEAGPGTAEFDAYASGHITNFSESHDIAALTVNFTLSSPTQVGFRFIFGSVEYPEFTDSFTDAFVAFLDGTASANQIVFDQAGNAVQVGLSFPALLKTTDTNTAFGDPHGVLQAQTFTLDKLAAGKHSLIFEVGDVNDGILDSAVFLSDFHAGVGAGGTNPVPEPGSYVALGVGLLIAVSALRRRRPV